MRTNRLTATIAAVAVTLLLVSCSSVDKDEPAKDADTPATTDAGTTTTRGITDDSIKVGGLQYDVFFGDAKIGVEARIAKANEDGGVHGRTIEFIGAENDDSEASKSKDIVTALVEKDEVFALLPVMSGGFGAGDYIQEHNVPTFGWGVNPAFCEGEVAFGITGCVTNPSLEVGSNALGTALEDMFGNTDETIAFLAEDNDAGKGGLVLLEESVKDVGFEVVFGEASLPAPPQQPGDVSPFVKDLMSADDGEAPGIIYLQATLSGTAISAALQEAGYEGMIITPSYSPLLLGAPGYDDIYINTQLGMDPSIEANAEMMEAVAKVAPNAKMSLSLIAGWYSADMFIAGLEATGEDLTVESFLAAMNDGFTYSVPDVLGESTWPENHTTPVPCSVLTKVENNEFDYIQKLACGSNIEID